MAGVALLQALIGFALAAFGLRFDGAVDLHRTWQGDAVPWSVALLDQFVAWPVAALAAWVALRLWRVAVPVRQLFFTLGAARIALVLVAPIILRTPTPSDLTALTLGQLASPPATVWVAGLVSVVGVVGFVTLVVLGLHQLTGARGGRLAAVSVSVFVAAEVASKLVLAVAS